MEVVTAFQKCLLLVVLLSLPAVLVATLVGVVISFIQAVMQLQEQTLPFALKLIAVGVTLLLTARWMSSELVQYSLNLFSQIPNVGR
ncbi:MAG: hypothetical protein RIR70_359 [Pseudomonadota bacterium]|jgi:type III secretion protein S